VSRRAGPPVTSISQMPPVVSPPSRRDAKAMWRPPGEMAGSPSHAGESAVRLTAVLPPMLRR
jgi:hypothetical protein